MFRVYGLRFRILMDSGSGCSTLDGCSDDQARLGCVVSFFF